jgi:hypothetical protein
MHVTVEWLLTFVQRQVSKSLTGVAGWGPEQQHAWNDIVEPHPSRLSVKYNGLNKPHAENVFGN